MNISRWGLGVTRPYPSLSCIHRETDTTVRTSCTHLVKPSVPGMIMLTAILRFLNPVPTAINLSVKSTIPPNIKTPRQGTCLPKRLVVSVSSGGPQSSSLMALWNQSGNRRFLCYVFICHSRRSGAARDMHVFKLWCVSIEYKNDHVCRNQYIHISIYSYIFEYQFYCEKKLTCIIKSGIPNETD